jgi:N-acetylglucosamine-6-sulfatase
VSAAAVAALLAVLAVTARTDAAPVRPPNVVVILADDERFDTLNRMANVRRLLASHGFTFRNAFVTTSECCPSRASILTGQYSHHTGVVQNFGNASYPQFDERSNLAVWLHDAGYETALVGKYLNDYTVYGHHHIPRGWSRWFAIDSRPEEKYYDYTVNENGKLVHFGTKARDYSTDVLAGKAKRFAKQAREPFFLYFAPITPHLPAIPAPQDIATKLVLPKPRANFDERDLSDKPWRGIYRRIFSFVAVHFLDREIEGRQLRSMRELDRQIGALVETLRQRGVLDRTVIVFASDNGFLWGEHRLGGKIWPYDESIRVPLVVRVPWEKTARYDDHFVLNIDFAPTIAALAGVKPRLREDGRSFLSLLRGHPTAWRRDFEVEYLGTSMYEDGGPPPFRAVRAHGWLYVAYSNGWRELYDLRRDPYELRNVASDPRYGVERARLERRLAVLMR